MAKLIKQVVEYAESKKRLECELDDTHSRLDACERSRDAARKAEETRKAELRVLTAKLDKALATVEAYRRTEKMEKTEKTTDAPEPARRPGPAAELWRMSPMTRAVVDEVRAVLRRGHTSTRAHEHTDASAGNSTHDAHDRKGGRSPAERQRPPLAVAPTSAGGGGEDHRGATRKSPTKASRMRAAAAAAAGAGRGPTRAAERSRQPRGSEEVGAAAARLRPARLRRLRGRARGGRGGGGGGRRRRAALDGPPGVSRGVPGPPRSVLSASRPLERERVLRFDPCSGAAGAFYFDASSETGSEARSERAACEARTVRQALGVPETESPPRGVSLAAATRALVRLDDDMTAYGAATVRAGRLGDVFATLDGVSPPRRMRASAFAPVRDEGASRLATIAARMARDDAYAERDAAPRSPHVPAPPASLVAAAARARVAAAGGDAAALGEPVGEAIRAGPLAADAVPRRRGRFAPRTVASPL